VWLCCVFAVPAYACDYPPGKPEIPEGKTATSDQMMTAQGAVKDYVSKMEAYVACVDQEVESLGDTVTEAQRNIQVQKHNAAVDEMTAVADQFNAEVRAYKQAQEDKKY
jgi:KaiC/GvpD/RAD55 family RecA-like ATPase